MTSRRCAPVRVTVFGPGASTDTLSPGRQEKYLIYYPCKLSILNQGTKCIAIQKTQTPFYNIKCLGKRELRYDICYLNFSGMYHSLLAMYYGDDKNTGMTTSMRIMIKSQGLSYYEYQGNVDDLVIRLVAKSPRCHAAKNTKHEFWVSSLASCGRQAMSSVTSCAL